MVVQPHAAGSPQPPRTNTKATAPSAARRAATRAWRRIAVAPGSACLSPRTKPAATRAWRRIAVAFDLDITAPPSITYLYIIRRGAGLAHVRAGGAGRPAPRPTRARRGIRAARARRPAPPRRCGPGRGRMRRAGSESSSPMRIETKAMPSRSASSSIFSARLLHPAAVSGGRYVFSTGRAARPLFRRPRGAPARPAGQRPGVRGAGEGPSGAERGLASRPNGPCREPAWPAPMAGRPLPLPASRPPRTPATSSASPPACRSQGRGNG